MHRLLPATVLALVAVPAVADDTEDDDVLARCQELDQRPNHSAVELAEWDELGCYERLYPALEAQLLGVIGTWDDDDLFAGDLLVGDFGDGGLGDAFGDSVVIDSGVGFGLVASGEFDTIGEISPARIAIASTQVSVTVGDEVASDDGERVRDTLYSASSCWADGDPTSGGFTIRFEVDAYGGAHSATTTGLETPELRACVAEYFLAASYADESGAVVDVEVTYEPAEELVRIR